MSDPKALQRRLETVLGRGLEVHEVTFRPMFGGITGYTKGRNFASLSNVGLALKLDGPGREELLLVPGAKPLQYDPSMPPSKQSVTLPEAIVQDDAQLLSWLDRSMGHCQAQPLPKKKAAKGK